MVGLLEDIFFSIWSSNKDAATGKGWTLSQAFLLKLLKLQKIQVPALKNNIHICNHFYNLSSSNQERFDPGSFLSVYSA